jgi:5-methylthioadenosine/S-adenosylhomocysteine deaminase
MDDQLNEFSQADILIRGSKIESIGPNLALPEHEPDLTVIDGEGKLVMPGLVNAHVHTPGNFVRGSLDNLPLEIFMLYEVPPLSENPPDYNTNYVRTMLGTMEMLKLGITSVQDDAFYVPPIRTVVSVVLPPSISQMSLSTINTLSCSICSRRI